MDASGNKVKETFRDAVRDLHDSLKNHEGKVAAEAAAEAKSNGKGGRSRD